VLVTLAARLQLMARVQHVFSTTTRSMSGINASIYLGVCQTDDDCNSLIKIIINSIERLPRPW